MLDLLEPDEPVALLEFPVPVGLLGVLPVEEVGPGELEVDKPEQGTLVGAELAYCKRAWGKRF